MTKIYGMQVRKQGGNGYVLLFTDENKLKEYEKKERDNGYGVILFYKPFEMLKILGENNVVALEEGF